MGDQSNFKKGLWDYPEAKERQKKLVNYLLTPKQFWGALGFIVVFLIAGYFILPLILFRGISDLFVLLGLCVFIFFISKFVAQKLGFFEGKEGEE